MLGFVGWILHCADLTRIVEAGELPGGTAVGRLVNSSTGRHIAANTVRSSANVDDVRDPNPPPRSSPSNRAGSCRLRLASTSHRRRSCGTALRSPHPYRRCAAARAHRSPSSRARRATVRRAGTSGLLKSAGRRWPAPSRLSGSTCAVAARSDTRQEQGREQDGKHTITFHRRALQWTRKRVYHNDSRIQGFGIRGFGIQDQDSAIRDQQFDSRLWDACRNASAASRKDLGGIARPRR